MPKTTRGSGYHTLTLKPRAPIFLEKGEYAFLSVQYAGDLKGGSACYPSEGEALCLGACLDDLPSYWSNSGTTPYSWDDLRDFGVDEHPEFGISVQVPDPARYREGL